MAFQVASGNEQRMRADVSELVYRARTVSAAGCQKTLIAPLPDYLSLDRWLVLHQEKPHASSLILLGGTGL